MKFADTSGTMSGSTDSLAAHGQYAASDSLGRMSTPSLVGTLDRSLDSSDVVTQEGLHWQDYRYLGGILETIPGVFIRDQNGAGQYNQITIRGQDWRSVAVTSDGRLLNDPASSIYNLYHLTTEYADRIEVITGPRAFLYGLNSSGGAINLVTKNYNSNKPFTKLNYSETAYNYLYSDGTFSQNISRKVNFTFGFQHQSTDGRYLNSDHEAWNMRVKLRYNISRDLNLILSEYLTSTQTGLNGGVDLQRAGSGNAIDRQTTMRNTDSYEKLSRNDVDLSLVGTVLGDSADVSKLSLYYSNNFREYRDEETRFTPAPNGIFIHSDHTSSWMGALFTQNLDTRWQRFNLGSNIELRQIEGSPNIGRRRDVIGSLWAKEELLLQDYLTVAGFARYDRYIGNSYTGFGADAKLQLADPLSLYAGLSVSRRVPTYEELYWNDSTVSRVSPIQPERHRQAELGASLDFREAGSIRASYFFRTVDDAIVTAPYGKGFVFPGVLFTNTGRITTEGVEARIALRLWILYIEGTATYLIQRDNGGTTLDQFPRLVGNGGIYFWNKVLKNKLEIKVGIRGRFQSSYVGAEFNPELLAYVPGQGPKLGAGSSADFFLIAHIGDAYIHLMWENLTSIQYYSTPFYPVLDREVRIGISWDFLN